MKRLIISILIVGLLAASITSTMARVEITSKTGVQKGEACTVEKVVDGDTLDCYLEGSGSVRVRLIGVDTPEAKRNTKLKRDVQRSGRSAEEILQMGEKAKNFAQSLLSRGSIVYLEFDVQKLDKYGRLLAYVWLEDGRMLNEVLLEEGYAQVYTIPPNVKYEQRLLEAQRRARQKMKGLWGEF